MQSYEIPPDQWLEFCDSFSREHAGWPVTIEVLAGSTGPQRLADHVPLQGISFHVKGTSASSMQIAAGEGPSSTVSHAIDLPLHISLAQDDAGADGTIQIEPARGSATLVHFQRPQ